jgi:hypothetical protein
VVALFPEFLARRHRNAGCVAIPVIDAPPLPLSFATARAEDPIVESFVACVRDYVARRDYDDDDLTEFGE